MTRKTFKTSENFNLENCKCGTVIFDGYKGDLLLQGRKNESNTLGKQEIRLGTEKYWLELGK